MSTNRKKSSPNSAYCLLCSKVRKGKNHIVKLDGNRWTLNGKNDEKYFIDTSYAIKEIPTRYKSETRICHKCYTVQLKVRMLGNPLNISDSSTEMLYLVYTIL